MATIPTADTHPKFHLWCIEQDLGDTAAAELLGVSRQIVRLWRLPFDDPRRVKPRSEELIEHVLRKTGGAVTAADWYPPRLRALPADLRGGDPTVLRHGRTL
jgi:hypothetical protein